MSKNRTRGVTGPGHWWLPLAVIPLLFLVWLSVTLVNIWAGPALGVRVSGYLVDVASVPILASYAVSLFAPFALYRDRQYVRERSEWTPSLLYLFVVLPPVNVPIVGLSLGRRHQHLGTP